MQGLGSNVCGGNGGYGGTIGAGGTVVYANESLFFPSFFLPCLSIFLLLHQPLTMRCPARIPCKSLSHLLCLDTSKSVHLLRFHRNLSSNPNFTSSPLNERDTVRVQGFMDGRCPWSSTCQRNSGSSFFNSFKFTASAKRFYNGGFHGEFDPVKGYKPDDVLKEKYKVNKTSKYIHQKKHTQTQTIPIHPPEMALIWVKPQLPKAAMIEETSCARQNAIISAVEGRSMKKKLWERVTKIKAWDIIATWRYTTMCNIGSLAEMGGGVSNSTPKVLWKKSVSMTITTNAILKIFLNKWISDWEKAEETEKTRTHVERVK